MKAIAELRVNDYLYGIEDKKRKKKRKNKS